MPVSKKRKRKKKTKNNQSNRNNQGNLLISNDRLNNLTKKFGVDRVNQFEHSVSGLILDFGHDLIERCLTREDYYTIIPIIILGWNVGNFDENERASQLKKLAGKVAFKAFENELQMLIDRKIKDYDQYDYIVVDFDISFPNDHLYLEVASVLDYI